MSTADLFADIRSDKKLPLVSSIDAFDKGYIVMSILWWIGCLMIIFVVKAAVRKRQPGYSLGTAGVICLLICMGLILMGQKFSNATMKSEICTQTIDFIFYGKRPMDGNGITKFLFHFDNNQRNAIRQQIYSVTTAINSAYTMYLNRLIAIDKKEVADEIVNHLKVKT